MPRTYATGGSSGGGTPGGLDTQVQFNDGGNFGGKSTFTFDKSTDVVVVEGQIQSSSRPFYVDVTNASLGTIGLGDSIDFGDLFQMYDNTTALSLDWQNRSLMTSAGTPTLDWANFIMRSDGASPAAIDFATRNYIKLFNGTLDLSGLSTTRNYAFQDQSGTLALLSDIPTGAKLVATGAVDGVNTVYSFSSAPDIIVIDSVPYEQTQSNGMVMWTGSTTVTLFKAPVRDIFGFGSISSSETHSVTFVLDMPTGVDVFPIWQIPYAVTLTSVRATIRGGTSLDFNLESRASSSLNSSGTVILASDLSAIQTGAVTTTFSGTNNVLSSADTFVVFVASAIVGTVNQIVIEINFTIN